MKCKECGGEIVGFATDGYCEDCLCEDCGTPLETDNERAMAICEECEAKREFCCECGEKLEEQGERAIYPFHPKERLFGEHMNPNHKKYFTLDECKKAIEKYEATCHKCPPSQVI